MEAFNAVRDALLACDTKKIRELYAEEHEDFGLRGEISDKKTVLQYFKPGVIELDEFTGRDVRAEVFGEIGIVRGRGYIRGRFTGTAFEHHFLFTDIFLFRAARWQYYKSHSTEIKD
jgi:hypothetical protein